MRQENAFKIRLIKLLEILRQHSDEDNYMSTNEIIERLAAIGIVCDRRTLYKDVELLNESGYEVLCEKSPGSRMVIAWLIAALTSRNFAFLWMRFKHRVLLRRKDRRTC